MGLGGTELGRHAGLAINCRAPSPGGMRGRGHAAGPKWQPSYWFLGREPK
jgi:hypothetical protein